jgi:hypothetical protein
MHKIFAGFVWFGDEIARRIVYLAGFFVLVSGAMSWLASYIAPIAQYGWAAVVLAGIGIACVIALIVSAVLVAWRYFHPLSIPSTDHEAQAVDAIAWRKTKAIVYHQFIDIGRSFLFSEPPNYEAWKAKIISTKSISNVQVCLDLSSHSGGVGRNFWEPKRRLSLMENVNFVSGAELPIDLMKLDSSRNFCLRATAVSWCLLPHKNLLTTSTSLSVFTTKKNFLPSATVKRLLDTKKRLH